MNYKTKILQYLTSTKPKYYVLMQELISNTIFDKILNNNSIIENKNNEESFIEKLTYFIDFFHTNFPSIKEKGQILELILTTNIPEFLTAPINLKEQNDKYIIYSMKKTIVNNFLTIFKQIRNNITIQELNKLKIKYSYNLDNLMVYLKRKASYFQKTKKTKKCLEYQVRRSDMFRHLQG